MPGIGISRESVLAVTRPGTLESRPQVYGISGWLRISLAGAVLDRAAGVHDQDVVGHLGDDAEVVGDHDDRRVELALEVLEQVEDLRLHGHVESGRRLVGDEQLRVS